MPKIKFIKKVIQYLKNQNNINRIMKDNGEFTQGKWITGINKPNTYENFLEKRNLQIQYKKAYERYLEHGNFRKNDKYDTFEQFVKKLYMHKIIHNLKKLKMELEIIKILILITIILPLGGMIIAIYWKLAKIIIKIINEVLKKKY